MRTFRLMSALLLPVVAAFAATQVVYASPPSDQGAFPLSSVPDCTTSLPATGGAFLCKAQIFGEPTQQAPAGEWIVIRGGIGVTPDEADGYGTPQDVCLAFQAGFRITMTIDGRAVPVDTIPCAYYAPLDAWFVDYRTLSHPLTPGVHTITQTWYATVDLPEDTPAGYTEVDTITLTVVPR